MKKCFVVLAVLSMSFLPFAAYAHGKADVTERSVHQDESWREVFDLAEKKDGKYNIMVTAEDNGGNVTVGGPFNIWIDPESDLPIAGITNPLKDMRVPGNLNIVGTCVDDDAVQEVVLILDGDYAHPIHAEGRDFWSYYLDTNDLPEGPHTIEAYGIDINGLRGHSTIVSWNLDRRQPVTEVTNYTLGTLVSGKINLKGVVTDGNGIKMLSYSLDGGQSFTEVKLHENKKEGVWEFNLPVDTRLAKDGPAICWFRATDKMGSVGIYSFLYFIDNTKPDVRIVSPEKDEVCNGKFGVAGYAKDVIGIQKLSWSFMGESGDFELIPGNPYWYKEVDTSSLPPKTKSATLTITALDTVGNLVEVKREILLDQELDKPVVMIEYPVEDGVYDSAAGTLFLRGIATDDDGGIVSIDYSLDGGEAKTLAAQGVFYTPIAEEATLPAGKHSVTVTAVDKYGIRGNPVSVTFNTKGFAPEIADAQIRDMNGLREAVPGIRVNSEDNTTVETTVTADAGIKDVSYRIAWGADGVMEKQIPLPPKAAPTSLPVSISLADAPWGLVRLTLSVTDVYDRVVSQTTVLNVQNLTRLWTDDPAVIFDDSTVSSSGSVLCDPEHPLTGFFMGGTAVSATLVPQTPFATVSLEGNLITLNMTSQPGTSRPVHVHVVTDQGVGYDSRDLIFHSDSPAPVVQLDAAGGLGTPASPYDGRVPVHITGSITSELPINYASYRIFAANADVDAENFFTGKTTASATDFTDIKLDSSNRFVLEIDPDTFTNGMYVIEVVADNGKRGADVAFVRRIAPMPVMVNGKAASPSAPAFTWFTNKDDDSVDVYWVANYQEALNVYGGVVRLADMNAGTNVLEAQVQTQAEKSRQYSDKKSYEKPGNARVFITTVDDRPFHNGMDVVIPYGAQKTAEHAMTVQVASDFAATALRYELSGEKVAGGDVVQTGKVPLKLVSEGVYEGVVPLQNLPARLTTVALTAETAGGTASYRGKISVVRERDSSLIDDEYKVYWVPRAGSEYNEEKDQYVLAAGTRFMAFANMLAPVKARFASAQNGLRIETGDTFDAVRAESKADDLNSIYIVGDTDGVYRNVSLVVTDRQGIEYKSPSITLMIDSEAPQLQIAEPAAHQWVRDSFTLTATASDANGLVSVEYSIDGSNWTLVQPSSKGYTALVSLDDVNDGLVKLDVRATDFAGKTTYAHTAVQKDTTPPEVTVVVPAGEDIVNGENLLAFIVKDNGNVARAEYVPPRHPKQPEPAPIPLELGPMVTTYVGTDEQPINDLMMVNFYDEVGNVTQIRAWDFIIDQQSDLPIAEIHLPEENAVITRDFTISGVVLDDDGPSKIWYKVDNGEYQALPEYDNSFAIDFALLDFTDNEHSITIYAEDIRGVVGPEYVRNFRISLEEPKGEVLTPPITETVKESVTLTGRASDKNGIAAVYVSIDNGNSYNEARGTFGHDKIDTDWNYTFDTRVIQDDTHVVFLKIVDWYGIEGLFSSLINIDNTAPDIKLELPLDGSLSTGMIFFSGQTTDNVKLDKLFITVRSLDGKKVTTELSQTDLPPEDIITQALDISSLDDGFYNIELTGLDAAENATRVSRNIMLDKAAPKAKVDLLYPLNGEAVRGVFNIYGTAVSENPIQSLSLFLDGEEVDQTELSSSGYYKFRLTPEIVSDGQHDVEVRATLENGQKIISNRQYLNYTAIGPWVTIDNFTYGDFAVDRPYLRGEAGYAISEDDLIAAKTKGVDPEFRDAVLAKAVEKVELSLDNGKTWEVVSNNGRWRYRVENKDIEEGYHFLLLRASMKNGETAITRTIVQVDSTAPTVRLISPGAGGRYNQELLFSGLTHDDVALKEVKLYLRKGDKAAYEVPAFIQGLYFDWQFWGATFYSIGAGLTFFDDNVKLQVQWGQFTKSQWAMFMDGDYRYGGDNIFGAKLLANVYYLPFRYLFGPDWEWLSMNVALGANFTHFSDSGSGKAQTLSAALFQLEFPRVTFDKQKMFRTIALYTEGQLWFIPSDVSSDDIPTLVPQISVGLRVNVF